MASTTEHYCAQNQIANFLYRPVGIVRGNADEDIVHDIKARMQRIRLAAEHFKAAGLVDIAQTISFSSNSTSDSLAVAAFVFSAASSFGSFQVSRSDRTNKGIGAVGGVFSVIGAVLGFASASTDNTTEEMQKALKTIEKDLVVLNDNLKKISTQMQQGFTEISREITQVFNEMHRVQKDIEISSLAHLVDDHLVKVGNGVADFLDMLANPLDSEEAQASRRDRLAHHYLDEFMNQFDLLLATTVGSSAIVSDEAFFDLLSVKVRLDQGNVTYDQWRRLVNNYLSKIHFLVVNGAFAIAWAVDTLEPNRAALIVEKYKKSLLEYFKKIYTIEPGVFYPYSDSNLFLLRSSNSDIQYTFTRAASGDYIEIVNTRDYPVDLAQLQILTNYSMSKCAVGFWGNMLYGGAGWEGRLLNGQDPVQQEIIRDEQGQALYVCYTIKYVQAKFKAKGKAVLNMSFSSNPDNGFEVKTVCGLAGAVMLPCISLVNDQAKTALSMIEYQVSDAKGLHVPSGHDALATLSGKRVVGYYTNYSMHAGKSYYTTDVPYEHLSVLSYCFAGFDEQGSVASNDSWSDSFNLPGVQQALARNPSLMAELLFGGWPDATDPKKDFIRFFRSISSDVQSRERFARNATQAMLDTGFSGIGVDWEYPEAADVENYIALLQAVRARIDALGGRYTLSVAVPAAMSKIDALSQEQWGRLAKVVDHINIMTYDYNGAWGDLTDFNAPLEVGRDHPQYEDNCNNSVKATVSYFKRIAQRCGIPTQKLAIGLAMYGRSFIADGGINRHNSGLYQTIRRDKNPDDKPDEKPSGLTPKGVDGTGVFFYRDIVPPAPGTFPSDMVFQTRSGEGDYGQVVAEQAAWGYSESEQWFIGFDSIDSMSAKVQYALDEQLGGVMVWDLYGDSPSADHSVMAAIARHYKADKA